MQAKHPKVLNQQAFLKSCLEFPYVWGNTFKPRNFRCTGMPSHRDGLRKPQCSLSFLIQEWDPRFDWSCCFWGLTRKVTCSQDRRNIASCPGRCCRLWQQLGTSFMRYHASLHLCSRHSSAIKWKEDVQTWPLRRIENTTYLRVSQNVSSFYCGYHYLYEYCHHYSHHPLNLKPYLHHYPIDPKPCLQVLTLFAPASSR